MPVQVDFVTMGDASKQLGVPAPTLRLWTEELEKNDVHYVMRNNRDERIYYDTDLEIFAFMRDTKREHGRKTQTKDVALMIYQMWEQDGRFELRTRENAPRPETTMGAMELLNHDDIKKIFENDRARQVLQYMVREANDSMKAELLEEVRAEVRQEMSPIKETVDRSNEDLMKLVKAHEELEKTIKESEKRAEERAIQRDENLMISLRQTMDNKKGFFAKLFGK